MILDKTMSIAEDIAHWRLMRDIVKEPSAYIGNLPKGDSMDKRGAKETGVQPMIDRPKKPEAKHTDIEAKYKPHLVTEEFIEAVAQVRTYGVKKYGHEDGWQITPDIDYLDAAARHINKTIAALQHGNMSELYDDELVDNEHVGSGLLNLAHAACDIMFIITKIQNNKSELFNKIKEMEDAK